MIEECDRESDYHNVYVPERARWNKTPNFVAEGNLLELYDAMDYDSNLFQIFIGSKFKDCGLGGGVGSDWVTLCSN